MIHRWYTIAGSVIVMGFAASSWAGLEFGATRYAVPASGMPVVKAASRWATGSSGRSTSRSGFGTFGGK